MGFDIVELVMCCEEVFAEDLPIEELSSVTTVGDLYQVICRKLNLEPVQHPTAATGISRLAKGTLNITPIVWNAEDVWATLVAVFVDQLQIDSDKVRYATRIGHFLGRD
jgi:hypothetical protein